MDGELRQIFSQSLRAAQWTPVETGATAAGVPDAEYCFPGGRQGWVEFKRTSGWAVKVRPLQVGWHDRRWRMGGLSFIAVRRLNKGADELYLVGSRYAALLQGAGLTSTPHIIHATGGPRRWDWALVERVLCGDLR